MRIFKTKWFVRFAKRERITDRDLREAVARAERGLIDADLRGGLIKQRVARAGEGRSGGYRTITVFRTADRAVFLYGFAKNERDNIDNDPLATFKELAAGRLQPNSASLDAQVQKVWWGRLRMNKTENKPSRLTKALLETAGDMYQGGLINIAAHDKITMRHLRPHERAKVVAIAPEEVKILREQAHMSQAVFARHLNVTVGYVSQLERGAKRATGAALALLDIIRRKGIKAIL